ncbi:MAG: arsenate reductase family protein [Sulfuricurvum sp.]|jgi:Spx/MgsR family transcriptional regulator|uniref:arsenate reductase family protein n=1 Tax=Sulfuricurvum sp. TaxID=2025608 RepID=UPI0025F32CC2|nr:arsenate reductase family protein [Sulfuricurvum sp.]MCK9374337.1 arsenate reductase family protein [Sulfuricurvum sp.]
MICIYGIKNCGSVKKAFQFFDAHALAYTFHDFKSAPVSRDVIRNWAHLSDVATLFNTKGTTYRTLNLKSLNLDDNGKIEWMAQDNRLIKRPVIEYEGKLLIGFNPSQYEGIFLA